VIPIKQGTFRKSQDQVVFVVFATAALFSLLTSACGGGGGGSSPTPPTSNPVPSITSLSPSSVTVGAAAQTLTINGMNFMSSSTVTYNSVAHTATYVSSTQLTIPVTASDQATAGTYAVVVTNPAPGGGASNSVNLTVDNPVPEVMSISPYSFNAGTSPATVTITGNGFGSGARVNLDSTPLTTTFVSPTQVTAIVPAASQIGGNYSVTVTNPTPGGGVSNAPATLEILPVVVGVSPASGPLGTTIAVSTVGADPKKATNNSLTFVQAGQTLTATISGTSTQSGGVVLTATVPSGLVPATAAASLAAPASVSLETGGLASTATATFEVQPPPHALMISPLSAEQGVSLTVELVGSFTSFDSSTGLTADDPGLAFSNLSVTSGTMITATLSVGGSVSSGVHAITATSAGNPIVFNFTVLPASTVPLVLSGLSASSAPPLAPLSLAGSGFTAGGLQGTSLQVRYSYSSVTSVFAAVATNDNEIDTVAPLLVDPSTGDVYTGTANVQVAVDGRLSGSQTFTIVSLPPNAGPVGQTTAAYVNALSTQLANEKAMLDGLGEIPSDQLATFDSFLNSATQLLYDFNSDVAVAANGGIVTAPDGSTFSTDGIDLLDRLVQTAGLTESLSNGLERRAKSAAHAEIPTPENIVDTALEAGSSVCDATGAAGNGQTLLEIGTSAVGLSKNLTQELTGTLADFGTVRKVWEDVGVGLNVASATCGFAPLNLYSVSFTPAQVSTSTGTPVSLTATGSFGPNAPVGNAIVTSLETILAVVPILGPGVDMAYELIRANGQPLGYWGREGMQYAADTFVQTVNHDSSASALNYRTPVQITPSAASFLPNPNGVVSVTSTADGSGFLMTPTAPGEIMLHLDLSNFQMLGADGNPTTDSTQVSGNSLPVTVSAPVANPVPAITALSPGALPVGSTPQALAINGTGFISTSNVTFNGVARSTSFVSSSQLTISLTSADLATTGSYPVVVSNPAPGGGTSNTASFTVTAAASGISISPTAVTVPEGAVQTFTATVPGGGGVTWSVQEGPLAGTITAAGIYTAPNSVGTFHVVAQSSANGSLTATATVTVVAAPAYSVLYSFPFAFESASLVQAANGSFYGTNEMIAFKIDSSGNFAQLAQLTSSPDAPISSLILASDGNFYGTMGGGGNDFGEIFRMDAAGNATTVYSFSNTYNSVAGGAWPWAGVIQGSDGNFYGTTYAGGNTSCVPSGYGVPAYGPFGYDGVGTGGWSSYSGCGTVFKMDSSGNVTTLYTFAGLNDGAYPSAPLVQASDGKFYGTASGGGASGYGTVFQVDGSGNFEVLHSFSATDGNGPVAGLLEATDGNLYGTTASGGASNYGAVFKVDTAGNFSLLHSFSGVDGLSPVAPLIQGSDGSFYGTTWAGGDLSCGTYYYTDDYPYVDQSGCGTVFKMDASGNVTVLHTFEEPPSDGTAPYAGLLQGKDGNLYGTTYSGGTSVYFGTVFCLSVPGGLAQREALRSPRISAFDGIFH